MCYRFWTTHLWLPLLGFVLGAWILEQQQLDLTLASLIYDLEGQHWALRNNWLFEQVLHTSARDLMVLAYLLVLLAWVGGFWHERLQAWQGSLGYLLLTITLSTLSVSIGKHLTHVDCPWSLSLFGGNQPYIPIFAARPADLPAAACFPAGHASAGYAWLGLYFVLWRQAPALRWYGLALALSAGVLFGVVQQFRGAHFISHDFWTLGICWFIAVILSPILLQSKESFTNACARC